MERRMYINSPKLATCNMEYDQSRTSQPSPRLIIQIIIVLHVSVILRVVADMCLVTLRPKKLKKPMENETATDEPRTRRLEMVWCHPRGRSKNGESAAMDGKRNGCAVRSRIENRRRSPPHPTATSGATEHIDKISPR